MSPHAAGTPRSTWKGKARAQPATLFAREDTGSGGEGGIVVPLDMLMTSAYESVYTVPLVVGKTQSLSVQVDTGSSDLWFASTSCNTQACKQAGGHLYDPSRSNPTNEHFTITYVEGAVDGPIVWDSVQIGTYTVDNQALAAANSVSNEPLSSDFSGVLGLALPANSVISSAVPAGVGNTADGAVLPSNVLSSTPSSSAPSSRFFSLTLERPGSDAIPSRLGIGRHPDFIDSPKDVQYAPIQATVAGPLWWEADVMDITVYVDGVPKSISLGASASTGGVPTAVVDSGMPIILASEAIANGIYGAMGIGPSSDRQYYMSCETPINMTITLDNRTSIALHPLDLNTPNSESSCMGLIQSYPTTSDVASIADIILGVPFMRNVYTVMSYDAPAADGSFPHSSSSVIHPRLGLLGLTDPMKALDEFHTVRVLGQPLPQTGAHQGTGHVAQPGPPTKKLAVGIEVLIGLVGFFFLCLGLFGVRWLLQRRKMRGMAGGRGGAGTGSMDGGGEAKDEFMLAEDAYRLARRDSYGSRYGPSEDTLRARRYGTATLGGARGEVKSGYTDDTARTRIGEDPGESSDSEKLKYGSSTGGGGGDSDAEMGYYHAVKRRSDSDTSTGLDARATLVGSPPLSAKELEFGARPMSVGMAEYPPSPTLSQHQRIPSAEASVAMPLLAHTRSESSYYAPGSPPAENMRVPLGLGHQAGRARVGSFGSADGADRRRLSAGSSSARRMSRVPSGAFESSAPPSPRHPLSISSLPPQPEMPLLNLGVQSVEGTPGSSSSNITTMGHS